MVDYPNLGLACYNLSDNNQDITKTEEHSLIIDLSGTPYTLSDDNWITAIGCDDMVVGNVRQGNRNFIGSGCASICQNRQILLDDYGECPYGTSMYWPGDGCCKTLVPRGTSYLEANLTDFSGRWPRTNFSCSYAFVGYNYKYYQSYPILNNSTGITPDDLLPPTYWGPPVTALMLDWRIGVDTSATALMDSKAIHTSHMDAKVWAQDWDFYSSS
ncbi:hypothetical protein C2S51_006668 [Perilla frutescens var. frutescens]|nr:hypothetical protein C2S51_006668 [Perilla frutescens var. frutescens]